MLTLRERFLGSLLGLAVGDAIGAPFEGLPATAIYHDFGGASNILANPPLEVLHYTDDTQLTIAVAEALIEDGQIESQTLVRNFAANFDAGRGYGQGARRIIELMRSGGDWNALAETIFSGGSLGNGAAMRVAPVALVFHHHTERMWEQARASALPTHRHPIGIEGAQLLALAISLAMREEGFDRTRFFSALLSQATTEEFRHQLTFAASLPPGESIYTLGSSLEAHRSVTTAIACFAAAPNSYPTVLRLAISLGDDTDTIAAMAGAVSGARLGISAIPQNLISRLEDGPKGRQYIESLALQLFDLHTRAQKRG